MQMRVHRARDPDSIRPTSEVLAEHMKREEVEGEEEEEEAAAAAAAAGAGGAAGAGRETFAYSKTAGPPMHARTLVCSS